MNLVGVELRRFFARRMVRGLLLIAAFIVVLSVSITTAKGHRGSEFVLGRSQDPATGRVSVQYGDQGPDPFFAENDTRMNIGKSLESALEGTGVAMLFACFAVGASFVGAEFNVGSLTTQLLFEPRRWRMHLATAMYVGSALHGVVQGVDGAFVEHRIGQALRISAAVGAGAMFAYGVTLVAKRSSAGMTIFFIQFPMLGLLRPRKMPFGLVSHYAPLRGLLAIIANPVTLNNNRDGSIHTTAGGVVLTAIWVVLIVGVAGRIFSRAEVR